jgi:hypothetical protein
MKEPDMRDVLIASLQRGNLQAVAMEMDGGAVRMFVEANPQYKSVNLYDSELKRVPTETLAQYQVQGQMEGKSQEQKQSVNKGQKEKNGIDLHPTKKSKDKSISKSS